jgi:excinuclease ABC subunit C
VRPGAGLAIVALAKEREVAEGEGREGAEKNEEKTENAEKNEGADGAVAGASAPAVAKGEKKVGSRPDRVFLAHGKDAIPIGPSSAEMFVLAHLRDEAHRFAVTFHRKQRKRRTLRSALADIPGIGPIRQRKMLAHFGSLKKVGEATLDELLAAPGMTDAAAAAVYEYFADRRPLPPTSTEAEATGSSESGRTPEDRTGPDT